MEAPLRRKSKEHPGSVLAMLVTHIKDQMDQSAVTETGSSRGLVTTGIKVMSYFNLFQPFRQAHTSRLQQGTPGDAPHCSRSRSPEARRSGKGGRHISSPTIHSPASIDVGRLLEYGQAPGMVPYGRCQRRRTGRNPGYQEARPGGVKGSGHSATRRLGCFLWQGPWRKRQKRLEQLRAKPGQRKRQGQGKERKRKMESRKQLPVGEGSERQGQDPGQRRRETEVHDLAGESRASRRGCERAKRQHACIA